MNKTDSVAVIVESKNHTHAGKPVAAGSRLMVSPRVAQHLVATKVARLAAGAEAATKKETN